MNKNNKTPTNTNPYATETRFIPHPDGRIFHITMYPWHWHQLDWLYRAEGITAGFILHMVEYYKSRPEDMSQAFIEFIDGSVCDERDIRTERENAAAEKKAPDYRPITPEEQRRRTAVFKKFAGKKP